MNWQNDSKMEIECLKLPIFKKQYPSIWEVEEGRFQGWGKPDRQSKFKACLGSNENSCCKAEDRV